jgi:translation initiation factor IF-1
MTSDNHLRLNGVVVDHAHDVFRIRVDGAEETAPLVRAKLSGKMRMNKINLQVADRVVVEVSVYDLTNGRIVQRLSSGRSSRQENPTEEG